MKPVIENTDEKIAMVETIITNNNGIVKKFDYWGKKALAYEMSDFREGLYVLIEYKADSNCTKELDRKLKIDEDILVNNDALNYKDRVIGVYCTSETNIWIIAESEDGNEYTVLTVLLPDEY